MDTRTVTHLAIKDGTEGEILVTLDDGSVYSSGGIQESQYDGVVVQEIALRPRADHPEDGTELLTGPVLTPAIAEQFRALGADVPAVHELQVLPKDAPAGPTIVNDAPPAAPDPAELVVPYGDGHATVHASVIDKIREIAKHIEERAALDLRHLGAELRKLFAHL